jgi:hypothetical protein
MSLFDIEISYQKLIKCLNTPSTTNFRIKLLTEFLSGLIKQNNNINFHSYFIDLLPELFKLIGKKEFDFIPPEEIGQIENIIIVLDKDTGLANLDTDFQTAKEILKGEKEKILSILENKTTNEKTSQSSDSVAIALIEKNGNSEYNHIIETGLIHNLQLSSSIRPKSEKVDKVEFKNLIDLNETEIVQHLNSVVSKAKEECESKNIKTHFYNFTFYFDKQDYIYSGSSLGIGAICLAYNSILTNELQRYYFNFFNDCVFSGEIDEKGNLNRLDNHSLVIKLRTIFYSSYKKFVIPEDNLPEAKAELARLNHKYPYRKLELIPVKNFESVFKNLDIVERYELKLYRKIKANYKKYQVAANWSLSLLTLFCLIYFLISYIIPHLDRNPVTHNYIDNRYEIYNKDGIRLWKSEELDPSNKNYYSDLYGKEIRCALIDINEDGINELIYVFRCENDMTKSRTISCSNPEIKNFPVVLPLRVLDYPNDPLHNFLYVLKGLKLMDCTGEGKNDILFWGAHLQEYPGILGAIDFKGNLVAEYWNEGMPFILQFINFNGNEEKDIYWCGCNNRDTFECAALIVFDPRYISGSSPLSNPLRTGKPGTEKYYLLFPRTILLDLSKRERNEVTNVQKNSDNTISCWTSEDKESIYGGSILYDFNSNMELLTAKPDDGFKKQYTTLRDSTMATLKLPDLKIYLNELKSKVRWWDGDKFVNHTAINRHYIEAKNKK